MADLYAIFGILLLFGVSYPALLAVMWMLFPGMTTRARLRLEGTPGRCFWLGAAGAAACALPILILLNLPLGLAKFLGWAGLVAVLGCSSLGAAGWATRLGARLARLQPEEALTPRAFLTGALLLELAAAFPLLGWLLFLPYSLLTSLGAFIFVLLRRAPRPAPLPRPPSLPEEGAALPQAQN
jgi:hypothetical protein